MINTELFRFIKMIYTYILNLCSQYLRSAVNEFYYSTFTNIVVVLRLSEYLRFQINRKTTTKCLIVKWSKYFDFYLLSCMGFSLNAICVTTAYSFFFIPNQTSDSSEQNTTHLKA